MKKNEKTRQEEYDELAKKILSPEQLPLGYLSRYIRGLENDAKALLQQGLITSDEAKDVLEYANSLKPDQEVSGKER